MESTRIAQALRTPDRCATDHRQGRVALQTPHRRPRRRPSQPARSSRLRSACRMTHEVERRFAQAAASPDQEMPRPASTRRRASTTGFGPLRSRRVAKRSPLAVRAPTSSSGRAASGVRSPWRIAKSHAEGENRAMMRCVPVPFIDPVRASRGRTFDSRPAFPRPVIPATFS